MEGAKTPMGNAGILRPLKACLRRLKSRPMESEVPGMENQHSFLTEPKLKMNRNHLQMDYSYSLFIQLK